MKTAHIIIRIVAIAACALGGHWGLVALLFLIP